MTNGLAHISMALQALMLAGRAARGHAVRAPEKQAQSLRGRSMRLRQAAPNEVRMQRTSSGKAEPPGLLHDLCLQHQGFTPGLKSQGHLNLRAKTTCSSAPQPWLPQDPDISLQGSHIWLGQLRIDPHPPNANEPVKQKWQVSLQTPEVFGPSGVSYPGCGCAPGC